MKHLSIVEFARLSGVDHATISRMVRDKRLFCRDGINPDDVVSKAYLTGRFTKIRSDADIFFKVPKAWTIFYIEKEGRRLPWCLYFEVKRIDYRKIIHLRFYNSFALNDDSETVTEKETGIAFAVESVVGDK